MSNRLPEGLNPRNDSVDDEVRLDESLTQAAE